MTESRYVSSGNRVFGTGNRSTIFEEEPKKFEFVPGPGMYESYSEFGPVRKFSGKERDSNMYLLTNHARKK